MTIAYYNLRPDQSANSPCRSSIEELVQIANCDPLFRKSVGEISRTDLDKLILIPQNNPLRWEKVMAGVINSITGKVPEREEVKIGRQLFEGLSKKTRKSLSKEDVFGFFPYILSGFKINLCGINGHDTNGLDSLISFTEMCFSGIGVNISSYLCAHKETREKGRDSLRHSMDISKANRAINLMKGVVRNSRSTFGSIQLHQYTGNPEGMNALFPQIFLKYYGEGKLLDLKNTLDLHYLQLKDLCERTSEEGLNVELEDASKTYKMAETLCIAKFGSPWRILSAQDDYGIFKQQVDCAYNDLGRLLRFGKICGIEGINDDTSLKAIEIFRQNQEANLIGKAALENMFYYSWGRKSGLSSGIAIGLDVDHDSYQIESFSKGYKEENPRVAPILYARKREDGDSPNKMGLNNLSIRQFWR